MVQLDLDNIYLQITNLDESDEKKIWNILSFPLQIYGMTEIRYRHLYNRKTKKTYAGLLPYVVEYLDKEGIEYQVNDNRLKPQQDGNFKLVDYIDDKKAIPFKLRPYQQEIVDNCNEREIIQACTGAGKAMPLDTDILTPHGFVPLRDIHVGDVIYDEDGKKTTVIGEFPQDELKEEYKITFKDGTSVICCSEHMWKYKNNDNFKSTVWHETTLAEMLSKYKIVRGNKKQIFNIAIPVSKQIQFDKKDLLVHPYVIGALLGDGGFTTSNITFTNVEVDIIDKVNKFVSQYGFFKHRKDVNHIQLAFRGTPKYHNPFRNYIKTTFFGVSSKDKFIPKEYLFSSVEDRLELARGLIDTDGSVNAKGHVEFGTTSKQLAEDFVFLIRSLGYRTKLSISIREGQSIGYNVYICCCDDILFSSVKHKKRYNNRSKHKNHYYDLLKIVSVEKLKTKSEMKCIAVDSPKKTFICKDFIVTHNTCMMAALIAKFNVKPVCIFADKIGLCMQLKSEMEKFLGVEVGLVGDGIKDYKDITVISAQSADEDYIKNANLVMWDECLPYDANVMLEDGTYQQIGDIVNQLSQNKTELRVMSYNIVNRTFELKKIIDFGKTPIGNRKLIRFDVFSNGVKRQFTCTDNHKIFIDNKHGYIMAKEIELLDSVVIYQDGKRIIGLITDFEYIQDNTKIVYDLTVEDNHNFIVNDIVRLFVYCLSIISQ